jgi:hypothetical protein
VVKFGETLVLIKDPSKHSGKIRSYFTSARKFGIWAPDDRVFDLPDAIGIITEYLSTVGQMLMAGHFKEAKLNAKERKRLYELAIVASHE